MASQSQHHQPANWIRRSLSSCARILHTLLFSAASGGTAMRRGRQQLPAVSQAAGRRGWRLTQGETRCSAIAERPRCRVRYSFGQKWKIGTGRQYFTDVIGQASTTVIYNRPENLSNSVKRRKTRAITAFRSFKVIEVGISQKPVCDFLLVINCN